MNIPNLLTISRILLVPLLVIFLVEGRQESAFWIFVLAGITDGLDGFLARILKQKTEFGAFIDPIADKLLLTSSFVTLAVLGILPRWLAVLVVSRDILICGGIGILYLYDRSFAIKPSFLGKATTFFQLFTVIVFLGRGYLIPAHQLIEALILLTALLTLFSAGQYLVRGFAILGNPDSPQGGVQG